MNEFEKYDEFLRAKETIVLIVVVFLIVVLIAAAIYFGLEAAKARGKSQKCKKEKTDNILCLCMVAAFLLPFIAYGIITVVNYEKDIRDDQYSTYNGRFQVAEVYVQSGNLDVLADVILLKTGKIKTYKLHPDVEDELETGVYDGYIIYSENTEYILDWYGVLEE